MKIYNTLIVQVSCDATIRLYVPAVPSEPFGPAVGNFLFVRQVFLFLQSILTILSIRPPFRGY